MNTRGVIIIAACLLALTGCGQKGPLYKPGAGPKNTRYIIKGSDAVPERPADTPAPADAAPTPAAQAAGKGSGK